MTNDLSLAQILLAVSTSIIGPFIVYLLIRYFDKKRFQQDRQLSLFRILISKPISILALEDKEFIEALNLIFVEFHNCPKIMQERRELQKIFESTGDVERISKQMEILLIEIAKVLNIKIKELDVVYGSYLPQHWINQAQNRNQKEEALFKVLSGKQPIRIYVDQALNKKEDNKTNSPNKK